MPAPEPPEIPLISASPNDGVLIDGQLYVVTAVDANTQMVAVANVKKMGEITALPGATPIKNIAPGMGAIILAFPIPPQ